MELLCHSLRVRSVHALNHWFFLCFAILRFGGDFTDAGFGHPDHQGETFQYCIICNVQSSHLEFHPRYWTARVFLYYPKVSDGCAVESSNLRFMLISRGSLIAKLPSKHLPLRLSRLPGKSSSRYLTTVTNNVRNQQLRPSDGNNVQNYLRNIDKFHSLESIDPTIFALSSGVGRAAIAVIRISGVACADVRAWFQYPLIFNLAATYHLIPDLRCSMSWISPPNAKACRCKGLV